MSKENNIHLFISKIFVIGFLILLNQNLFGQYPFYSRNLSRENSQECNSLYTSPTRIKMDLNGYWQYSIDGSPMKNIIIPAAYDFTERVVFQRNIDIPTELIRNKYLQLVCYGINYQCEVYINNEFVGHHVGGYSTFSLKIPEHILNIENSNTIKIVVDNNLNTHETVPLQQQIWGWRNYGGIYRDIYLLASPPVYFDDVYIQPELNEELNAAQLKIAYSVNTTDLKKIKADSVIQAQGNKINFDVYFQIYEKASNNLVAQSQVSTIESENNRNSRFQTEFTIQNPNLWSPSNPSLYYIRSIISKNGKVIDQLDQDFGIRKLSIINNKIYLNGKQFLIKGTSRVEDYPGFGNAVGFEDLEKDILLMKNLGVNVIINRFCPATPYLINLCDKYGIFLCEEIPVWNTPSDILINDKYITTAENYIREMVLRDRNHPSVFAWGIGSYFDSSDPLSSVYCERANSLIKNLDNRFTYLLTSMIVNDTCFSYVDLPMAEINVSSVKVFSNLVQKWKQKCKNKPILISVLGAPIQPDNHNGYGDIQSVEYQAYYIQNRFRALQQEGISGTFLSVFADWYGERPVLQVNNQNQFLYTTGLVSNSREVRISYNMLKTLYNDEKTPTLIVGDYNASHPLIYIIWGLILLILFAYVFNSFRRFRENIVRSFLRPYNFYADIRDQRIFSNIQTTIMAFIISGTFALVTSNLFYYYRYNGIFDYVLTHFISNNSIKSWLNTQIWNPTKFILMFTLINLICCLLLTLLIKLGAVLSRRKIFLTDSYAIVIWSALPIILLVPVGMVLSRIIDNDTYLLPLLGFVAAEILWILYRILKGIAIVYDIRISRIYAAFLIILIIFGGSLLVYYNYEHSTIAYMKFVINLIGNSKI
jgi:beta-galactosidase